MDAKLLPKFLEDFVNLNEDRQIGDEVGMKTRTCCFGALTCFEYQLKIEQPSIAQHLAEHSYDQVKLLKLSISYYY